MTEQAPSAAATERRRAWLGAMAIDAAAVLTFVTVGRRDHEAGTTVAGIFGVAAPFLIGAAAGWLLTPRARQRPLHWRTGAGVWVATLVVGMLARRFLWDRGTGPSFVVVTAVVVGVLMFGWRALFVLTGRRHEIRSPAPPSKADR